MKRYDGLKQRILHISYFSEAILALFIIAGVMIGAVDLVKHLWIVYRMDPTDAYEAFKSFLGHVLLLAIGLELVIMLVKHCLESVLEVLTFAIARKLLISAETYEEMALGILALAGVFAIRKFLHVQLPEEEEGP